MGKIPVPVVVGVLALALVILGVVLYKGLVRPAGDSGDVSAITSEVIKNNPQNAPEVPDNLKPSATAVMGGGGRKSHGTK